MKTLRDFLRANCMDSVFPESLDGNLLFMFGECTTTNYCFDEADAEIGIEEAKRLILITEDNDRFYWPLDKEVMKIGFQNFKLELGSGIHFQVAKLQFIQELG